MSFILGNLVPPKKEKTKKTPMLFNLPLKKEEPKPLEPEIPVEALEEDVDCDGNVELECETGFNDEDEAVVNVEMEEE